MTRGTLLLPLLLVACSSGGGAGRPTATPTTAPPTSAAPTTAAPTTAAPTSAAPTATTWPPPSIRVTTAREYVEFRTPSGNIACGIGTEAAGCEIREYTWRLPPKDPSCEFDWVAGVAISLGHDLEIGLCRSDTVMGAARVLEYGTGIRYGEFTCISEQAGVTCAFESGSGFFLSRGAVREV